MPLKNINLSIPTPFGDAKVEVEFEEREENLSDNDIRDHFLDMEDAENYLELDEDEN